MFLTTLKTKKQQDAFLSVAVAIAQADQQLHEKETELLAQYKRELGLNRGYKPSHVELSKALSIFKGRKIQRSVYLEWLALARVDGIVSKEETFILKKIADTFAISTSQAKVLERWLVSLDSVYKKGLLLIEN